MAFLFWLFFFLKCSKAGTEFPIFYFHKMKKIIILKERKLARSAKKKKKGKKERIFAYERKEKRKGKEKKIIRD